MKINEIIVGRVFLGCFPPAVFERFTSLRHADKSTPAGDLVVRKMVSLKEYHLLSDQVGQLSALLTHLLTQYLNY